MTTTNSTAQRPVFDPKLLLGASHSRADGFLTIQRFHHLQAVIDDCRVKLESGATLQDWKRSHANLGFPRRQLQAELRQQLQLMATVALTSMQDAIAQNRTDCFFKLIAAYCEACERHAALNGFAAPTTDPVWNRLTPPLAYGCRCARVLVHASLINAPAKQIAPAVEPARGFDFYPAGTKDCELVIEWMQAQCDPEFDHPFNHEWPCPRHAPDEMPLSFWLAPPSPNRLGGAPWLQEVDAIFERLWPRFQDYQPVEIELLQQAIAQCASKDDLIQRLGMLSPRDLSVAFRAAMGALIDAFAEVILRCKRMGRRIEGDPVRKRERTELSLEAVELLNRCVPLFRDTDVDEVWEKYEPGLLLREPGLVDMTYKLGGFTKVSRYLIFSAEARQVDQFSAHPEWGLCLLPPDSIFKVLARYMCEGVYQITLLHVPEDLREEFTAPELTQAETVLVAQAKELFTAAIDEEPLPEHSTELWLDRLKGCIGISDEGEYFEVWRGGP